MMIGLFVRIEVFILVVKNSQHLIGSNAGKSREWGPLVGPVADVGDGHLLVALEHHQVITIPEQLLDGNPEDPSNGTTSFLLLLLPRQSISPCAGQRLLPTTAVGDTIHGTNLMPRMLSPR